MRHGRALAQYFAGLGCTVLGAWWMAETGSMWPLAFGASASVMCTWSLVRALCTRQHDGRRGG
jgi:hypothetical protein